MSIQIGMPPYGGPRVASAGLIIFARTSDYCLRAMDMNGGEEVWKTSLAVEE